MQKLWPFEVRTSELGILRELRLGFSRWKQQRMDGSTNCWMKHAKPVTKLDLGHKLNTTDFETKLCKRLKVMAVEREK
jgi:hypothetical protein